MKPKLDAVTFAPHALDSTIQARMHLGSQEIVTTWPKSQDMGIARLVDQLSVKVAEVTLARTEAGREIQATLSVAERPLLVSWVVEENDGELGWVFEKLLKDVTDNFVRQLRNALGEQQDDESDEAEMSEEMGQDSIELVADEATAGA